MPAMPALLAPPRPAPPTSRPPAAGHWAVRAVLLAGGVAVAGLWWVNTIAGTVSGLGGTVTALGRVTGLFAGYLVLVQLLLMARLPWFERAVGFDRLAGWHRGLGTNTVVLVCAHVLLIVEGYALTAHHATLAQAWTVLSTYPDMLKATAGLALFLLVGLTSAPRVRRRLSYEAWYWLHVSAYLAIALAFFHQTSTGADFRGADPRHLAARVLWTAMYAAVAGAVLWWRVARPLRGWFRHRLLVEKVVPEADGVVSIWVRGRHLEELGGRAGQFLLWRFIAAGHLWTTHPYAAGRITGHFLIGRRAELAADPLVPEELAALVPDAADRDVFVCGPVGMTATVRQSLRRLHVPRRQIHSEEFSLS